MDSKWELRDLARKLRSEGLSYRDIRKRVPVSKSTVSSWCSDIELSQQQRHELGKRYDVSLKGAKAVQSNRRLQIDKIVSDAIKEVRSLKIDDLKIMGPILYWAEGNKTLFAGITNSDPAIIIVAMKWFREICKVPEKKFKAHLHIHGGQDDLSMKKYWSNVTDIPLEQFGKSHVKKNGTGYRKNKLYNGTIKINIFDKNLLHKILGWIEGIKLQFTGH